MIRKNKTSKATLILVYSFICILILLCVVPFYIMIINSTRSSLDINSGISLIPGKMLLQNYKSLSSKVDIFVGLRNSAVIAISATVLSSYFAALAAFGLRFYDIPYKKLLIGFVLLSMMVPPHLGLIGYFQLLNKLNLLDTLLGVILPGVANAFTLYFLYQYIGSAITPSLIEAARLDGASELRLFHRVALPLMMPGIATMSIFSFVMNWNNYIIPLVIIFTKKNFTVPMMIAQLNSMMMRADFGAIYLGVALSVVPILIAFMFLSKYIVAGVSLGGVKE